LLTKNVRRSGGTTNGAYARDKPMTSIEFAELGEGQISDCAAAVGGPIHEWIVHNNNMAIGAEVNVQLQNIGSVAKRVSVSPQRRLGSVERATAVRSHD
jgi:hypothetical protein